MVDEAPSASAGTSFKKLGLLALAAVALSAIPMAGPVVCFVLAGALHKSVKRDRLRLIDYDPDDPITPVTAAAVGTVVRVVGKVEPTALHEGLVSGLEVPFAKLVVHRRTTGRHAGIAHAFTEDFGDTITLRDATGIAVVPTQGMELVGEHVAKGDHYGPLEPGILRDGVMKHIPGFVSDTLTLELTERSVHVGDELSVTARVEQSEQAPAADERGYRQGAAEQRILMGPRGDGSILASTYDLADIAAIERNVATLRVGVPLVAFLGIAGFAAWWAIMLLYVAPTGG